MLPDLHEDIPLGLGPLAYRHTGERDNDRLAVLGKQVLELAVMHGLFSQPQYFTGDEMEVCGVSMRTFTLIFDFIAKKNRDTIRQQHPQMDPG